MYMYERTTNTNRLRWKSKLIKIATVNYNKNNKNDYNNSGDSTKYPFALK